MIAFLPYQNLDFVSVIDEYDTPLLIHYKDVVSESDILQYIVNIDEDSSVSLIWKAKESDIFRYISNKITLRALILEEGKEFIYLSKDKDFLKHNVEFIEPLKLNEDYLPNARSYYGLGFPEEYEYLREKFYQNDYVAALNDKGIVLRIEPSNKKYANTVSIEDIHDFTGKISGSYSAFVQFEYLNKFKSELLDPDQFEKAKKNIVEFTKPRVCDAQFGSFEITISNDPTADSKITKDEAEWSSQILDTYAEKILYFDYTNTTAIQQLIQTSTVYELKKIYEPFLDSISQKKYKVDIRKISDNAHVFYNPQGYKEAKKKIRKAINDSQELDIDEPSKKKLMCVVVEVDINDDVESLKSSLTKNVVTKFVADHIPISIDQLVRPERTYNFKEPWYFDVRLDENTGQYIIENDYLEEQVIVDDKSEIQNKLLEHINHLIDSRYDSNGEAYLVALSLDFY